MHLLLFLSSCSSLSHTHHHHHHHHHHHLTTTHVHVILNATLKVRRYLPLHRSLLSLRNTRNKIHQCNGHSFLHHLTSTSLHTIHHTCTSRKCHSHLDMGIQCACRDRQWCIGMEWGTQGRLWGGGCEEGCSSTASQWLEWVGRLVGSYVGEWFGEMNNLKGASLEDDQIDSNDYCKDESEVEYCFMQAAWRMCWKCEESDETIRHRLSSASAVDRDAPYLYLDNVLDSGQQLEAALHCTSH